MLPSGMLSNSFVLIHVFVLIKLHSDAKWHVRLAFVHQLPLLATNLGIEFFKESLNDVCVNLLTDPVFDSKDLVLASKIIYRLGLIRHQTMTFDCHSRPFSQPCRMKDRKMFRTKY